MRARPSPQNLAQEQLGPWVLRIVEVRRRRIDLQNLAVVHEVQIQRGGLSGFGAAACSRTSRMNRV